MLLNQANPLPPKEVIFEHVAVANSPFSFTLALLPAQLALGVRLFINGLQQKPDSFTATTTEVDIPGDLEVKTGDVIQILYYESL